jgi:hypothetical protein
VSDAPAPFAAGVHLPWAEVPDAVQRWAAVVGGGPPTGARDLRGGFSPGAVARLEVPRGEVFIKAVGRALNPESPGMHRREAEISAALPRSPRFPRLIDTYDDGDWVALAFEAIDGDLPRTPWEAGQLAAACEALAVMHRELTPCPQPSVAPAAIHLGPVFVGWARLASMGHPPPGLDSWSVRHLDRLAALESRWAAASLGDTLVHGDIRSDNMLIGPAGTTFVDWPHASVATPVLDLVEWAPSVALEGGPDPEELLARHQPSSLADPDVVDALLTAVTGYLISHSLQPAPPGLPTLRAFQAAQGEVARAWLARRTGWT